MKHHISIVKKDITVEQLIRKIDRSKYSITFITKDDGSFISQISIYKLRRLLLSGLDGSEAVSESIQGYNVKIDKNDLKKPKVIKSILTEMEKQEIEFCPILSSDNKIIEIYDRNDLSNSIASKSTKFYSKEKNGYVRNVLVVGGAGYLGSVLVRDLLDKGYFVRVLDNFIYGKKSIKDIKNNKSLEIIEGDFRNIETIVSSLSDIDAVILLAAIVGDPASELHPIDTIETNLLAAQALASACKYQQINRFIYASTCSVYGKGKDVLDEESPLNPISLYARTKIASEESILGMANDSFSPTILRLGTLYGYSPRMRFDLVVNTMTMKVFLENKIQVFGGGKQWRPLLHVKDASDAFIKCLESPIDVIALNVLNVGSELQNYQIIDIAEVIRDSIDGNVELVVEKSNIDSRDYKVSFKKIKNELKFKPQYTISNAVKEIYKNLKNGVIKNPLGRVYYNHYFDSTEE
ncbi:GDP-L-fucose synthase [subsurface metagenome]